MANPYEPTDLLDEQPPLPPETRRTVPTAAAAAGSIFVVLVCFVLGSGLQLINLPFGLILTSLFVFGGLGVLFPALLGCPPLRFTGLSRWPAAYPLLAVLLGLANLPFANVLMGVLHEILPKSWSAMEDQTTEIFSQATGATQVVLVIAAAVAAPIGEELFFRGWLQGLLAQRYSRLFSVVAAATVFSLVHLDAVGFPARLELGIVFGLVRIWSGSLWPSIALHAAHNFFSIAAFLTAPSDTGAPDETLGMPQLALGAGSLVAIVLGLRLFHWLTTRTRPFDTLRADEPAPLTLNFRAGLRLAAPLGLILLICVLLLVKFRAELPGANLKLGNLAPPDGAHAQQLSDHVKGDSP